MTKKRKIIKFILLLLIVLVAGNIIYNLFLRVIVIGRMSADCTESFHKYYRACKVDIDKEFVLYSESESDFIGGCHVADPIYDTEYLEEAESLIVRYPWDCIFTTRFIYHRFIPKKEGTTFVDVPGLCQKERTYRIDITKPGETIKESEVIEWKTHNINSKYGSFQMDYSDNWNIKTYRDEEDASTKIYYIPPYGKKGGGAFLIKCKSGIDLEDAFEGHTYLLGSRLWRVLKGVEKGVELSEPYEKFTSGNFQGIKLIKENGISIEGYAEAHEEWTSRATCSSRGCISKGVCGVIGDVYDKESEDQLMQMLSSFEFLEFAPEK